jgi:hypothetical protein
MVAPSKHHHRILNFGKSRENANLEVKHKGVVSSNAKRKIRSCVDWLLASADEKFLYSKKYNKFFSWKISFLTLTIPTQKNLSDKEIKRILNAWLQVAKYTFGLKSYIWKAEKQKRGAVHIHLTSDCFLWHTKVRYTWNRLLAKSGLLNGHENPNSIDIHSVYKVRNMAAYLCKYFCKDGAEGGVVDGRLWGCSRTLSNAYSVRCEMGYRDMVGERLGLEQDAIFVKKHDYCTVFYLKDAWFMQLPDCRLRSIIFARLRLIRKPRDGVNAEIFCNQTGQILS